MKLLFKPGVALMRNMTNEANRAISEMDSVTRENLARVEAANVAAHTLEQESDQLNQAVSRFKIIPALDKTPSPPRPGDPYAQPQ